MATKKKALKKSKLRHAEYYDFQKIQDKLYAESMDGKMFTKLVEIITLPENIKLAYRNIKKNKGSKTAGTDAYQNLILLCGNAHRLIHATDTDTIARLTDSLNLTPKQKTKVDKLRSLVHVESC